MWGHGLNRSGSGLGQMAGKGECLENLWVPQNADSFRTG